MTIHINDEKCIACGACAENCVAEALEMVDDVVTAHPELCESCGVCTIVCPKEAISLDE